MNYVYRFTKEKKLTATTTRMATIVVFDRKGKEIGKYSWSRKPNDQQIKDMLRELIREYETRAAWNGIAI